MAQLGAAASVQRAMRIFLVSMCLLAGLAACVGEPAAAAPARVLHPHLVHDWVRWLGPVDATRVAFGRVSASSSDVNDLSLAVRDDAGATKTFAVPTGCSSQAAGGGRIVFQCGYTDASNPNDPVRHLAVMSATGDEVARPDARRLGSIDGVGAQWIASASDADTGATTPRRKTLLNWRTGEERVVDPTDPGTTLDLDVPSGVRALCAPLRSVPSRPARWAFDLSLLPVTLHAPWALVTTEDGIVGNLESGSVMFTGPTTVLRRCGSGQPVAVPEAFRHGAVLGYGWLAANARARGAYRIDLWRLSDGHRFIIPRSGVLSFTRRRLYIFTRPDKYPTDYRLGSVATVQLPTRYSAPSRPRCRTAARLRPTPHGARGRRCRAPSPG
jgi:hypothetical protein